MKKISTIIILLFLSQFLFAQTSGGNGFLVGNYVEVGIAGQGGYEGADLGIGTLPGLHWRSDIGNNSLGFVANPSMDNWVNFNGDFFTPGSPENGWGFEVGTVKAGNNGYGPLLEIPGSVTNWSNVNGCIQVDWHGDYANSGLDLSFDIIYKLNENELFYSTEVRVKNNSATALNNFYYYRNIDPDNNEVLNGDYSTTNRIVSQPNPPCSKALVSATQSTPWASYLGLAAIGDNFRVCYGGFSNRDASDMWSGAGVFTNTVGSQNTADEAISLTNLIPVINPGETKTFKFLVILDAAQADNAINTLFYFDYAGGIGNTLPECTPISDTAITCASIPVNIGIQGDALNDFNWLWSPTTGLSNSTGTTNVAQPSTTTTYTVIGTPVNPCYVTSVTKEIVVLVLLGPDAQYVDPGPQCGTFDLNTLVHNDANNTPGVVFNFYTSQPSSATDTSGVLQNPGNISQGDSIWVVYSDTARGCFDAEFLDIQWGIAFSLEIDVVDASCGQSNGSANVTNVVGGFSPYTYQWTSGPSTPNYDNIGIGFYTITVTDSTGCSTDSTIQVNELSNLSVDINDFQHITCNGYNDGFAVVEITGGTQPFSIEWNDPLLQQNDTATGLAPGVYTVTVTDANLCSAIDTIEIIEPSSLIILPVLTNIACNGSCDGQIVAAPSGGTPFSTGSSYHYQWNTSPMQNSSTATNLCAGSYTVTVSDANGCSLDSTFTLTQPSAFVVTTSSENASCGNNDGLAFITSVSGGSGSIFHFNWGVGLPDNDTLFNASPGLHSVTISNEFGCDTTITINVGNNAGFTVVIDSVTPVSCKNGADGFAIASGSDVLATYTYSWSTIPIQTTQSVNNLTAGVYIISITDIATGCIAQDSVVIIEPDSVSIATISSNNTICSGQSTTLTATATGGSGSGYVYTWNNGLGAGQNQIVTPAANTSTTFTVTALDANGCPSNSKSVTVTVHPNLTVVASADDTICPGTSATINAIPAGGNGDPYSYIWTPNTNISSTTAQSPTVTPTVNTTYTVTLSDGCSPTVTDQVTISLFNLPQPNFRADTLSVCIEPREVITFYNTTNSANNMLDTNRVSWNFGDGTSPVSQPWDTISHTYNQPGTYSVSLNVYSQTIQGGCPNDTTIVAMITVHDLPVADFTSSPNPTSMFEPEVQFTDQSQGLINQHFWDFAGLDSNTFPNPIYNFPDTINGDYPVKLTVTDIYGCQDTITKNVKIIGEFGVFVPNAFTPDFDGKNDVFGPKGFGVSPEGYKFQIFDRWGEKIFESDLLFDSWNGFYKGNRVQEGVYVWKLFFKDINGKKHQKIGHFQIIQ